MEHSDNDKTEIFSDTDKLQSDIDKLDRKINILQNKKELKIAKLTEKSRKQRTRALIVLGSIFESLFRKGSLYFTLEEIIATPEKFITRKKDQELVINFLRTVNVTT